MVAALALALALGAADPCVGADGHGRPFRTCFAPGQGLELSAGGVGAAPQGEALAAGLALRLRSDTFTSTGRREWLRDLAFLEARARFQGSYGAPRSAEATLFGGLFLRRLAEPFLLVPGPRPIRLPFPFDVGLAIDAGSARWTGGGARPEAVEVEAMRGALLLDVARHLGARVRRAAFGPEVSWAIRFEEGSKPVQSLAPFTAGRVELRAESVDGLASVGLSGRAGALLRFPGEAGLFWDGRLAAERVVVAVNDVPVAAYLEASARGGALERELAAGAGVRVGWLR